MTQAKRSKYCSKCGSLVEPERRHKQAYCRSCHAENMRKTRKDQFKNLSENDKKKVRARVKVKMWAKRKNFQKPGCQICGCAKVEMHHANYEDAYLIAFLCKEHHIQAHKGIIQPTFQNIRFSFNSQAKKQKNGSN